MLTEKFTWSFIKKNWMKPEVYPIVACVIGVGGLVAFRLGLAASGPEVQLVSKHQASNHLRQIIHEDPSHAAPLPSKK